MLSVVLIEKQMVLELVERRWNIVEFFRWRWSPDQCLFARADFRTGLSCGIMLCIISLGQKEEYDIEWFTFPF